MDWFGLVWFGALIGRLLIATVQFPDVNCHSCAMLRTNLRRGIPCRPTVRGWDPSRRVASIGQREFQIQADSARAETATAEPVQWKSCLIPLRLRVTCVTIEQSYNRALRKSLLKRKALTGLLSGRRLAEVDRLWYIPGPLESPALNCSRSPSYNEIKNNRFSSGCPLIRFSTQLTPGSYSKCPVGCP